MFNLKKLMKAKKVNVMGSLGLFLFMSLGMVSSVFAEQEVQLLHSWSSRSVKYNWKSTSTTFTILVENLNFEKDVAVWIDGPDGWEAIPAVYKGPADANREVWTAEKYFHGYVEGEFAVRYTVNGVTYWDNNNGANYNFADNGGQLYGTNVFVRSASGLFYDSNGNSYDTQFHISVDVQNIDFDKAVKVRYTTDNWATYQEKDLRYLYGYGYGYGWITSPNNFGVEAWNTTVPIAASVTELQYVVSYTVAGTTYWDNNFGLNYKVVRKSRSN